VLRRSCGRVPTGIPRRSNRAASSKRATATYELFAGIFGSVLKVLELRRNARA
jgi:hypothetical protein